MTFCIEKWKSVSSSDSTWPVAMVVSCGRVRELARAVFRTLSNDLLCSVFIENLPELPLR
jgi:hypothetical protein